MLTFIAKSQRAEPVGGSTIRPRSFHITVVPHMPGYTLPYVTWMCFLRYDQHVCSFVRAEIPRVHHQVSNVGVG
jgi:hypothetical protein